MGRIRQPELQTLSDQWSPVVRELLDEIGQRMWPPRKFKKNLFSKTEIIPRHILEGPALREESTLVWALSHTRRPSTFDAAGNLSQGEREFWLIMLTRDNPLTFTIMGAQTQDRIPAERGALEAALHEAYKYGPKVETYYGNKGPLSHKA